MSSTSPGVDYSNDGSRPSLDSRQKSPQSRSRSKSFSFVAHRSQNSNTSPSHVVTSVNEDINIDSSLGYDLSIVVALVSPIGNWLTGGDHVKNVLLMLLLIFYLHQVVEGV